MKQLSDKFTRILAGVEEIHGILPSRDIRLVNCGESEIVLETPCPTADIEQSLLKRLQSAATEAGLEDLKLKLQVKIPRADPGRRMRSLPEIRNIIAVTAAKGGVGKSTIAVNLALALRAQGAKVGLLDADIHGPSQGLMLGVDASTRPKTQPPKYLLPVEACGLQTMSMAYLLTDATPLAWRGPMVSGALQQMTTQTLWKDLDYLIMDMPPGTGDIQLTLAQKVPVAGVVVVTTPQQVALGDVRRGVEMFVKLSIPILGVIENMAYYRCSKCGEREELFGADGGGALAGEFGVDLLGSLPLQGAIRSSGDRGEPLMLSDPDGEAAGILKLTARRLACRTARLKLEADNLLRTVEISDAGAS